MKRKLYVETSVVSYLVGRASPNTVIAGHQAATQALWKRLNRVFVPFISDLVIQESSGGDPVQASMRLAAIKAMPILAVDQNVESVARILIKQKAVPEKCPEDAVHIATAAVNKMALIVTWNFKHINNPVMKQRMRDILARNGYVLPEICSPDELLEVEDD